MKIDRGRYISWLTDRDFMAFNYHYNYFIGRLEDFNLGTVRLTIKDLKHIKRK